MASGSCRPFLKLRTALPKPWFNSGIFLAPKKKKTPAAKKSRQTAAASRPSRYIPRYAGGALPDAAVEWIVRSSATNYRPPGWDRFEFGIWQPWWYFYESYRPYGSE